MSFLKSIQSLKFIGLSLTAVFLLACGYPGILELVPLAVTPTPITQVQSQGTTAGVAGGVGTTAGAVNTPITRLDGGQPPQMLPTTGTVLNLKTAVLAVSVVLFLIGGGWFIYKRVDRY